MAFLFVLTIALSGSTSKEDYRLRTYNRQFETSCSREVVLDVFYHHKHYKRYTPSVDKVTVLKPGNTSYVVKYSYAYIWGDVTLTYKKTIFPSTGTVTFELLEYTSTSNYLPKIVQSRGYYRVEPGANGKNKVTYRQEFRFDKDLSWVSRKVFDAKYNKATIRLANYIKSLEPGK